MNATRFALAALIALSLGALPPPAFAEGEHSAIKHESSALWYSLAGTAVPFLAASAMSSNNHHSENDGPIAVVAMTGYVLGPSAGHFYAARPGRALIGIGIRAAALGIVVASFAGASGDAPSISSFASLGILAGATSLVVDIGAAPKSARIHNGKTPDVRICVLPAAIGPDRAPGMRISIAF